jgi:hypothetical protein
MNFIIKKMKIRLIIFMFLLATAVYSSNQSQGKITLRRQG